MSESTSPAKSEFDFPALLMTIPPSYLPRVVEGLAALSRNGFRYPIPPWGIQADPSASMAVSYG